MAEQEGVISQQQAPELDADQIYRADILNKIKPGLQLACVDGEVRINVDNVMRIIKIMEIHPRDESILDLIRESLIETRGEIDAGQFESVILNKVMTSELEEEECIKAAFSLADYDADGHITGADIYRLMMGLGEMVSDSEIMTMLRNADLDGDGRISLADFTHFMMGTTPETKRTDNVTSSDKKVRETSDQKQADVEVEERKTDPAHVHEHPSLINLQRHYHHGKRRSLDSHAGCKVDDAVDMVAMCNVPTDNGAEGNTFLEKNKSVCLKDETKTSLEKVVDSSLETETELSSQKDQNIDERNKREFSEGLVKRRKSSMANHISELPGGTSTSQKDECPLYADNLAEQADISASQDEHELDEVFDKRRQSIIKPKLPGDMDINQKAELFSNDTSILTDGGVTKQNDNIDLHETSELPDEIVIKKTESIDSHVKSEPARRFGIKRRTSIFHTPELPHRIVTSQKESVVLENQFVLPIEFIAKLNNIVPDDTQELPNEYENIVSDDIQELPNEIIMKLNDNIVSDDKQELPNEIIMKLNDNIVSDDKQELPNEIIMKLNDNIVSDDKQELPNEIIMKLNDNIVSDDKQELPNEIIMKLNDNIAPDDKQELPDELVKQNDNIAPDDKQELPNELIMKLNDNIVPDDKQELPNELVKKNDNIVPDDKQELPNELIMKQNDNIVPDDKQELPNELVKKNDNIAPDDKEELPDCANDSPESTEICDDFAMKSKSNISTNVKSKLRGYSEDTFEQTGDKVTTKNPSIPLHVRFEIIDDSNDSNTSTEIVEEIATKIVEEIATNGNIDVDGSRSQIAGHVKQNVSVISSNTPQLAADTELNKPVEDEELIQSSSVSRFDVKSGKIFFKLEEKGGEICSKFEENNGEICSKLEGNSGEICSKLVEESGEICSKLENSGEICSKLSEESEDGEICPKLAEEGEEICSKSAENSDNVSDDNVCITGSETVDQFSLGTFQGIKSEACAESGDSVNSVINAHRVCDDTASLQDNHLVKCNNTNSQSIVSDNQICIDKDESSDFPLQPMIDGSNKSHDSIIQFKGIGSSESIDAILQQKEFGRKEEPQDGGTAESIPDDSAALSNETCSETASESGHLLSVKNQAQQTSINSLNEIQDTDIKETSDETRNTTAHIEEQLKTAKIMEEAILHKTNTVGEVSQNQDKKGTRVREKFKKIVKQLKTKTANRPMSSYTSRRDTHQSDHSLCRISVIDVTASIEDEQAYKPDKVAVRTHHGFNSIRPLARVIMAFNKTTNAPRLPQFTSLSRQLEESKLVLSWDDDPVSHRTKRQGGSSAPASGKTTKITSEGHLSTNDKYVLLSRKEIDSKYSPVVSKSKEADVKYVSILSKKEADPKYPSIFSTDRETDAKYSATLSTTKETAAKYSIISTSKESDAKYSPTLSTRKETRLSVSMLTLPSGNEDEFAHSNQTSRPRSSPIPYRRHIYSDHYKPHSQRWDKIKNAVSNQRTLSLSGRSVSKLTSGLGDTETFPRDNVVTGSKRTPVLRRRNAFNSRNELTQTLTCSSMLGRRLHNVSATHRDDTETTTMERESSEAKPSRISSAMSAKRTGHSTCSDVIDELPTTAMSGRRTIHSPCSDVTAEDPTTAMSSKSHSECYDVTAEETTIAKTGKRTIYSTCNNVTAEDQTLTKSGKRTSHSACNDVTAVRPTTATSSKRTGHSSWRDVAARLTAGLPTSVGRITPVRNDLKSASVHVSPTQVRRMKISRTLSHQLLNLSFPVDKEYKPQFVRASTLTQIPIY